MTRREHVSDPHGRRRPSGRHPVLPGSGPDGDGPWPALLEALPYRKDDVTASYRPEYQRLAEAGYVMCRVDVRGTGTSEGIAEDEYPAIERTDLVTVIDWLATRDWSTGSVGMYGTSYSGFNSIQLAMERPPALKAIIPIFATDDRFGDDVHYFGGALKAARPRRLPHLHGGDERAAAGAVDLRRRLARGMGTSRARDRALAAHLARAPATGRLLEVRFAAVRHRSDRVSHDDHRRLGRRLSQQHLPHVRGADLPQAHDHRAVVARLHRHVPARTEPRPDPRTPASGGITG